MPPRTITNEIGLDPFWMPFTANRQFKKAPRLLAAAQGMYYTADDGRPVLDGTAGLWCVNAGHGRLEIAQAVADQLCRLDYAPSLQMGHPVAFQFAEELAAIAPAGLDRIFFTNSGSESVDTALKIARAYQCAVGRGERTRLIGRERGYHGVGFGGISVGGMGSNRRMFGPLLPGTDHLRHTYDPAARFTRGLPGNGATLADDLERLVQLHGAETIAAVIVEPVAGSTGVLPPPQGYLERLRNIATRHGILLIFDEVITGFGRLGTPFATEYFGITPDIVTTAKGLTNGAVPMGAVFASRSVYDVLMHGPESAIELFHGYTYSGHPTACAAGRATLQIYQRENLLTRAAGLAEYWENAIFRLKNSASVIDIRVIGLMAGIELEPRAGAPGARAYDMLVDCFGHGLLIRVTGDTIALSPPLIISEEQIDTIVTIIADGLARVA